MRRRKRQSRGIGRTCVHGSLLNDTTRTTTTCVCDLFWRGANCDIRDCQAGVLNGDLCHCDTRNAGEFCEYAACYHKNALYCRGIEDEEFQLCNTTAIGGHVPAIRSIDPAWYCPCGQGIRTKDDGSGGCVCRTGYTGEFCDRRVDCPENNLGGFGCSPNFQQLIPPAVQRTPIAYFGPGKDSIPSNTDPRVTAGGGIPDSATAALVCLGLVMAVAVILWLKKVCTRMYRSNADAESGHQCPPITNRGQRHLRRARRMPNGATRTTTTTGPPVFVVHSAEGSFEDWNAHPIRLVRNGGGGGGNKRGHNGGDPRVPTYEEANADPPSYTSVVITARQKEASDRANGPNKTGTADHTTRRKTLENNTKNDQQVLAHVRSIENTL